MFLAFGNVNRFGSIAQRHPGLPLIIDHMGVNTAIAKEGKMVEKIGDAVALAKYPNVGIKMSNLVNASLEPYPFRDLDDHLKRVFDAYGPQRCYWGTDLTNTSFTRVTWSQRITHFTEELKFISESDKAASVYQLDAERGDARLYFLRAADNELRLLDHDKREIPSSVPRSLYRAIALAEADSGKAFEVSRGERV